MPKSNLLPTKTHKWVKHSITEIAVISNLNDEPIHVTIGTPVQEAFGCIVCSVSLTMDTAATSCEGENYDD